MVDAGTPGVIVNITSVNDRVAMNTHGPYCTSKAGLSMLTKVAAIELGPHGIRVVAVAPGVVETPLVAPTLAIPAVAAAMTERTPLGSPMGSVDDVSALVAFLASDEARRVTGDTWAVDGGQLQLGFPDMAAVIARAAEAELA